MTLCISLTAKSIASFIPPLFEEQYVDYGMNKLIWIYQLREMDVRFRVLLHSFIVHVPHPALDWSLDMTLRTHYDKVLRSTHNHGQMTAMDLQMKVRVDRLFTLRSTLRN